MADERNKTGRRGEDFAAAFLVQKGFRVVARNWRCRFGEIDLIVERGGEIRFVEVKCRRSTTFGYPEESITKTKRQHLRSAIECWLHAHPVSIYQADAIALLEKVDGRFDVSWIEGIL